MSDELKPNVRPIYNSAADVPRLPAKPTEPKLDQEPPQRKPEYPTLTPEGLSNEARIEVKMEQWKTYQKLRQQSREQSRDSSLKKGFNRSR